VNNLLRKWWKRWRTWRPTRRMEVSFFS